MKSIGPGYLLYKPHAGIAIFQGACDAIKAQEVLGRPLTLVFNDTEVPIEDKTAEEVVRTYWSFREGYYAQHAEDFGG